MIKRRVLWVVGVVWCVLSLNATATSVPRLRPLSDQAAQVLAAGRRWSPTIRTMLDQIEQSDIILHIDFTLKHDVPRAVTRLVTATTDFRYVRVSVNPRQTSARRLELFAHELQHVLEIAAAPEVRDQAAMVEYFKRIGTRSRVTGNFETDAALAVELTVRGELSSRSSRELNSGSG